MIRTLLAIVKIVWDNKQQGRTIHPFRLTEMQGMYSLPIFHISNYLCMTQADPVD